MTADPLDTLGATTPPLSFEAALAQLEAIAAELDDGQLGLAEALARYEQGVKLLRACHGQLEQAERRIVLVTGVSAEGELSSQPFVEPTEDLAAKSASRSRRRTARTDEGEPC